MNSRLKQWALAGVGTGLALTIAFGVVGTSFAQSTTQDQGQTQQDGSSFAQRGGPGGMHRGGKGGFAPTVIAEALGITEDELHTAMQDGVSVSDLASEKGVSLDTIVNAVIADETAELAQAVTDGKLTQEQADQRIADMTEKLPDQLSQVPPARPEGMGPRGMGGPGGHGRHGGFDQNGQPDSNQQAPDSNSGSSSSSSVAPAIQTQNTNL